MLCKNDKMAPANKICILFVESDLLFRLTCKKVDESVTKSISIVQTSHCVWGKKYESCLLKLNELKNILQVNISLKKFTYRVV